MGGLPLIDVAAYLAPSRIFRIDHQPAKTQLLDQLAAATVAGDAAEAAPLGITPEQFRLAIQQREALANTALGAGLAIPHARVPGLGACRITLAACPQGIAYGASDGAPVRLIAMIAARDEERSEHLRILATLAATLSDPARFAAILAERDPHAVIAAFR